MKVLLAYNIYEGISGETTFFNNMKEKLGKMGVETRFCGVPMLPRGNIASKFEFYSRWPLLLNAYNALKPYRDYEIVHFLNSSLSQAGRFLRNEVKLATSHFTQASQHALSPPENPLYSVFDSLYSGYVDILDKTAFNSLDCLVTTSPYQADFFREHYKMQSSKLRFIPPGIDFGYFRKLPKRDLHAEYNCDHIIVYVGRLHERSKGVSYLIRAMKHLKGRSIKLLIVGDGPDKLNYIQLAKKEGIDGLVVFLGKMDFNEKSVIQRSADVAVMPSRYEVFGTVFAESLACGTPMVAFDLPFWKGLYENAGVFAKPCDEKALAEAISLVLDDPKLRKSIIAEGLRLAESYDINKVVDAYVSLYGELLENKKKT
ncbi:MAG: glycosyltransferase family 4 protein [Candidatus Micrarchaeota archaeon]|nr:glycosyltransferase family 4 protein [Candidatus Micrarchaeota archaeon]